VNLSNPLSSFMSGLDAIALRVVARSNAEFTGRQVARLAEIGTPANIRLSLLRLAAIGLIKAVPAPHATMYSANRDHILWPAIEIALNAREELGKRIAGFARTTAPGGVTITLYGSVARNASTSESDIDLLVVFPDAVELDVRDEFVTELRDRVQLWSGNDAQIYDVTESTLSTLREKEDPMVASWETEGILLYGKSARELTAKL
jgi:predicted nucleotidyltransferase